MNIPRFTDQSLLEVYEHLSMLREEARQGEELCFEVPNPDLQGALFSGEPSIQGERPWILRSYRVWMELGELMRCRFKTPQPVDESFVRLRWEPLDVEDSWHLQRPDDPTEKYGADSLFFRIHKLEEPFFLLSLREIFLSLALAPGSRILCLGSHKGDEFHLLRALLGAEQFSTLTCVGIDHCKSAVAVARERFGDGHVHFVEMDLNQLDAWEAEPFDLILSVGTLQSPGIESHALFRSLVQRRLCPAGSIVLGLPNCRYVGGELQYGARIKNYESIELSLLFKDAMFYKRYLQQHRFKVRITGKYYVFLWGSR